MPLHRRESDPWRYILRLPLGPHLLLQLVHVDVGEGGEVVSEMKPYATARWLQHGHAYA